MLMLIIYLVKMHSMTKGHSSSALLLKFSSALHLVLYLPLLRALIERDVTSTSPGREDLVLRLVKLKKNGFPVNFSWVIIVIYPCTGLSDFAEMEVGRENLPRGSVGHEQNICDGGARVERERESRKSWEGARERASGEDSRKIVNGDGRGGGGGEERERTELRESPEIYVGPVARKGAARNVSAGNQGLNLIALLS